MEHEKHINCYKGDNLLFHEKYNLIFNLTHNSMFEIKLEQDHVYLCVASRLLLTTICKHLRRAGV